MNITFYRIYCKDTNITDCYVGHTKNFKKRNYTHKYCFNTINRPEYNFKIYTKIRENGGWENWIMEELENTNCNDKRGAVIREQELILEHNAKLNTYDATFNREKELEYHKNYNKIYKSQNKELISQKAKEYYAKKKAEKNN